MLLGLTSRHTTALWVKFSFSFYFVVKETEALEGFSSVEGARQYHPASLRINTRFDSFAA